MGHSELSFVTSLCLIDKTLGSQAPRASFWGVGMVAGPESCGQLRVVVVVVGSSNGFLVSGEPVMTSLSSWNLHPSWERRAIKQGFFRS